MAERKFALIGHGHFPISQAEIDAGLTSNDIDIGTEYGDVRRYGAIGDGVADDTSPIQTAFDAATKGTQ